jgi:dolichyl-phosphate beta-glucosyltransferase
VPARSLTVVIPAYNEARRLPETLDRLREGLEGYPGPWEILVSDDGSTDDTVGLVARAAQSLNGTGSLKALACAVNLGKGAAVRRGCLAARSDLIAFTDADLAIPVEDILRVFKALDDADVAVGTRRRPAGGDERDSQPTMRRLMGRAFSAVQRLVVPVPERDTQCPLKAFRAEAARSVFARSQVNGWAFDVEVLRLAHDSGCRVVEVPVRWQHREGSRLRPSLGTIAAVMRDLARIRRDSQARAKRAAVR